MHPCLQHRRGALPSAYLGIMGTVDSGTADAGSGADRAAAATSSGSGSDCADNAATAPAAAAAAPAAPKPAAMAAEPAGLLEASSSASKPRDAAGTAEVAGAADGTEAAPAHHGTDFDCMQAPARLIMIGLEHRQPADAVFHVIKKLMITCAALMLPSPWQESKPHLHHQTAAQFWSRCGLSTILVVHDIQTVTAQLTTASPRAGTRIGARCTSKNCSTGVAARRITGDASTATTATTAACRGFDAAYSFICERSILQCCAIQPQHVHGLRGRAMARSCADARTGIHGNAMVHGKVSCVCALNWSTFAEWSLTVNCDMPN